jgi:hypothetical protein
MNLPVTLHPDNPHYYLFRGRPAILITSAEHYGAVINLDFDYVRYLDVLARKGLNYTRIYAGAYLEPEHYFIRDNTLGPRIGRHCLPWGRGAGDGDGYPLGGRKLDLDQWNGEYFDRLQDFVAQAGRRDIVVEICFFNAMYPDTWALMPLYHANNIQGVGRCDCKDFQTLTDAALVARQEAYVRKITQAVAAYDNVILEICDEPGIHGTPPEEYTPWLSRLVEAVAGAECDLPARHLIAQQVCGELGGPGDLSADPRVQVIVGQYIWEVAGAQYGGMRLLDTDYGHDKPIELNETAYYPIWYRGDLLGASRVEAWEFIVGGGASFNQLNGLFSTFNPAAEATENEALLGALANLKHFMAGFDFTRMRRDPALLANLPAGAFARGMSEPGRQYALYIHHSECQEGMRYEVVPGVYQEQLSLRIGAGQYNAVWIDPACGAVIGEESITHSGGACALVTPPYQVDVALRIKAI